MKTFLTAWGILLSFFVNAQALPKTDCKKINAAQQKLHPNDYQKENQVPKIAPRRVFRVTHATYSAHVDLSRYCVVATMKNGSVIMRTFGTLAEAETFTETLAHNTDCTMYYIERGR